MAEVTASFLRNSILWECFLAKPEFHEITRLSWINLLSTAIKNLLWIY